MHAIKSKRTHEIYDAIYTKYVMHKNDAACENELLLAQMYNNKLHHAAINVTKVCHLVTVISVQQNRIIVVAA